MVAPIFTSENRRLLHRRDTACEMKSPGRKTESPGMSPAAAVMLS